MSLLDRLIAPFVATPSQPLLQQDSRTPLFSDPDDGRADAAIANPLTGLGGWQDKGQSARPQTQQFELTDTELTALYRFGGVARRIVEVLPSRSCRRGWSVPEIEDADRELRTWSRVQEALTLAQLYGGAVLLPVTIDDLPPEYAGREPQWLATPLDPARVGRVVALHAFSAWEAFPVETEGDVRSPNFRRPRYWQISTEGWQARVHASRVVYFAGRPRPLGSTWSAARSMPDDPILQVLWDEVRNLGQINAAGATLAQELRTTVLKLGDLGAKQASNESAAFRTRLALMAQSRGLLGFTVVRPGDDLQSTAGAPTGFGELSEAALTALCAALGWPRSLLTGESPGGLSTEDAGGRERERAVISDYQEETVRSPLEQLYAILYAAQDGPTGGVAPEGWALTFAPVDQPSEAETANLRKVVAETDAIYLAAGVYGPASVAESRFGDDGWTLDLEPLAELDPSVEDGIDRTRQQLEQDPAAEDPADPAQEDRADASGALCLLIDAPDPGLRAAVEQAIGQSLIVEDAPHVTVLYLGADPARAAEVAPIAAEEATLSRGCTLADGAVVAFPAGPNGTPIVVAFESWQLDELNSALTRRLAHLITAPQHRRYRPHLTIGYAARELDPAARARLGALDASTVRVAASELRLVGTGVDVRLPLGG